MDKYLKDSYIEYTLLYDTIARRIQIDEVTAHDGILKFMDSVYCTGYKLKMTGDVKSVQGDTEHAESDMVMDVYARVIDEDRRFNAKKLDEQFYGSLGDTEKESIKVSSNGNDMFFANLIDFMSDESNRKRLQEMMESANT